MSHAEILKNRLVRWQYQAVKGGSLKKRKKGLRKIHEIMKRMNELASKA
jgi:hypothetical protein